MLSTYKNIFQAIVFSMIVANFCLVSPILAQTKNLRQETKNKKINLKKLNKRKKTAAPADTTSNEMDGKFDYGDTEIIIPGDNFGAVDSSITMPNTAVETTDTSQTKVLTNNPKMLTNNEGELVTPVAPRTSNATTYQARKLDMIERNKLLRGPKLGTYPFAVGKVPTYSAEDYRIRLAELPTIIPMDYNETVGELIKMYVLYRREQVVKMLPRTDIYYPIIETSLDRHDMPMELKYLPVILSAMLPNAKSQEGATGLWQLSYGTARLYNLQSNNFIDERRDPLLSTEAAVMQLKSLYKKYNDWLLAIAAFSAGEGTVNKAIRRSGNKSYYWNVAEYMPAEAQTYVPLFIAATYVMNYYHEHNLRKHEAPYTYYVTDTIRVYNTINLKNAANYIGMSIEELQFLNPAVKKNIIPKMTSGFPVNLPASKIGIFQVYVNNMNADQVIIIDRTQDGTSSTLPANSLWNYDMDEYGVKYIPVRIDDNTSTKITYVVQVGDHLHDIASRYDCTVDDLRRWNRLTTNYLNKGQELAIYVPKAHEMVFKNIMARRQQLNDSDSDNGGYEGISPMATYEMRAGDNLELVGRTFGVTAQEIMEYNKLTTDTPAAGTLLKIPPPKE